MKLNKNSIWLRMFFNNRGEVDPTPNPDPDPKVLPPDPVPSAYEDLATKKGFKTQDDFASNYTELETDRGRQVTKLDTINKQLEAGGYQMDETGKITPKQGAMPTGNQQPQQQQYYDQGGNPIQAQVQPQQDTFYDLNNLPITNQIDRQLAQMPVSQRIGYVVNAMADQRDKLNRDSFAADTEVLSKPEAKGFESDVRAVMQQVPIAQRATKQAWEDALLKVKGMKFDQMQKDAGAQGVEEFINKANIQNAPASSGGGKTTRLDAEQEKTFQFYESNHPGMFKDRAHFLTRCNPQGK